MMYSQQSLIKIEEGSFLAQPCLSSINNRPFHISKVEQDRTSSTPKISEWTSLENAKYAVFIERNLQKMRGKPHGKLWSLYQEMSRFIKTRNFRQCKLHHQKLTNQIGNIPNIIAYLMKKVSKFQDLFQKEKQNLELICQKEDKNLLKVMPVLNQPEQKNLKDDMIATDYIYRSDAETEKVGTQIEISRPSLLLNNQKWRTSLKEQKWKECHNYFVEWTSRLNELMAPQLEY